MNKILIKIPGLKEFYLFLKENIIFFFEKKKWKDLSTQEIIKLELGSTKKSLNDFKTVDYWDGDIRHNLKKKIPLKDSIVDEIYTSHTLEHFNFNEILFILKESNRILKKGGKLKVCLPNAKFYIDSYNKKEFFNKSKWYEPAIINTGSYIDQINYIAYLDGQHKFLFDEQNVINIIKMCGFSDARLREFEKDLDVIDRDYESVYALGIK